VDGGASSDAAKGPGDAGAGDASHVDAGETTADRAVDTTTMRGKMLLGYQGWFACAGDGSPRNRWVHWTSGTLPDGTNMKHDMWPDVSELGDDELFATNMKYKDGSTAKLYSGYHAKTIARHFAWMQDAGIDGVMVQRFLSEVEGGGSGFEQRNGVLDAARRGAEQTGRVFMLEYDISGANGDNLVSALIADWKYLVDTLKITHSPRYLQHKGKPVVALWGFGFEGRPGTAEQAKELIAWFHNTQETKYQATLVGGVPTAWRTAAEPWASTYRLFDVVSPWTVGRFGDDAGADHHKTQYLVPDQAACDAAGIEYLPVVFPGFSWSNWNGGSFNQIPRRGGRFYWRQVHNALDAGATMIKTAMFDEVDEGTAMYKVVASEDDAPVPGPGKRWLALDADGESLPSDWYLRIAGQVSKALRGEIEATATLPITP
jgi:hypothetical protein